MVNELGLSSKFDVIQELCLMVATCFVIQFLRPSISHAQKPFRMIALFFFRAQHVPSAQWLIINIPAKTANFSCRSWWASPCSGPHFHADFPRNAFQLILRNMVRFGVVVSRL